MGFTGGEGTGVGRRLPFVPRAAVLTAFGRQALNLVARDLRQRGIASLLAPDHYCPTMFVPFQLEGVQVHEVVTGSDCLMNADALARTARDHRRAAVLHCETFGNLAGPELDAVLKDLQSHGIPVVVDQTHSLLGTGHFPGNYAVASLRKLLPVPDGAWVRGLADAPCLSRSAADEEVTALFAEALTRGASWPASQAEAESALDDLWAPAAISPQALVVLGSLDPSQLVAERRRNAARLRAALPGVEMLNPDATECCLAISHPRAESIADELAAHGIVAPVQWARPLGLRPGRPWRTDLLTLPANRQLTDAELELVGTALRAMPTCPPAHTG
jgi:hypothetical protein